MIIGLTAIPFRWITENNISAWAISSIILFVDLILLLIYLWGSIELQDVLQIIVAVSLSISIVVWGCILQQAFLGMDNNDNENDNHADNEIRNKRNDNYIVPYGTESIKPRSFSNNVSLTYVEIPDTVEEVGHQAFEGCSSIESIQIHAFTTSIRWSAFKDCSSP